MSKKHKMGWVSNNPVADDNVDFLYSDDALDALINQSYGPTKDRNQAGNEPADDLDLSPIRKLLRDTAREVRAEEAGYAPEPIPTRAEQEPVDYDELMSNLANSNPRNNQLPPARSTESVVPAQMKPTARQAEGIKPQSGMVIADMPHAVITKIDGCDHIVISDGHGNSTAIPIAKEAEVSFSLKNMMTNLAAINGVSENNIPTDVIDEAICDLASTMAHIQVLWGKPEFAIDVEELDDYLADLGIHSYDGTSMTLVYKDETEYDSAPYVYCYIYKHMESLYEEWHDIIAGWKEEKPQSFDKLLITLLTLYQIMVENRYVCHSELGSAFTYYLEESDHDGNPRIGEVFTKIAPALPDDNSNAVHFNITWNDTIKEVIASDITKCMCEDCADTLSLFFEQKNENDEEPSDETYPNPLDDDDDETDAAEEGTTSTTYAEDMAAQFAAEYAKSHPGVQQVSGAPQQTGYVRNAESAGAPVGGEDFRSTDPAPADTKVPEDDHHASAEESNPYGATGSNSPESNPDTPAGGKPESSNTTTDRPWNANQSFYEKGKEETQTQKAEEKVGNGSGNVNGIQHVQKEAEKVTDADDDLIIPVVRG